MFFLVAAFVFTIQLQAQIAVVNYMKVKQGGEDAFIASERTWKKLHQQRVNEGKMLSWALYYVHGSGTTSPFSYVTVDLYPDMKAALAGTTTEELKKIFGDKYTDVIAKTTAARELAYSEMYNWVMGFSGKEPDKFLIVSYMNILDNEQYYKMEKIAYQPMHKVASEMGNMNSWSVWSRPFWNNTSFEAATVNGFTSVDQMTKSSYSDEIYQKATAGLKPDQLTEFVSLVNKTSEIREMIRTQLWETVEVTTPKK